MQVPVASLLEAAAAALVMSCLYDVYLQSMRMLAHSVDRCLLQAGVLEARQMTYTVDSKRWSGDYSEAAEYLKPQGTGDGRHTVLNREKTALTTALPARAHRGMTC